MQQQRLSLYPRLYRRLLPDQDRNGHGCHVLQYVLEKEGLLTERSLPHI